MQEYQVEIKETLSRIVTVVADSNDEAIANAQDDYNNESVVLDASDFQDVEFGVV